ncbi:MAG TPA: hypothetical protein DIT07_02625 [Sphingobacteriaceae bacterium]|nr:hypothetical protein [Sphingobacteriaceae bacterium]
MIRKLLLFALVIGVVASNVTAQDLKASAVPAAVKAALVKKYPASSKVLWEKENGNYEANWGGKSGEDNSVVFTPAGTFMEIVNLIPVSQLPAKVAPYVKDHYKGAKIAEAGKATDAKGTLTYEAELKGMVLIFDSKGNFLKKE